MESHDERVHACASIHLCIGIRQAVSARFKTECAVVSDQQCPHESSRQPAILVHADRWARSAVAQSQQQQIGRLEIELCLVSDSAFFFIPQTDWLSDGPRSLDRYVRRQSRSIALQYFLQSAAGRHSRPRATRPTCGIPPSDWASALWTRVSAGMEGISLEESHPAFLEVLLLHFSMSCGVTATRVNRAAGSLIRTARGSARSA